MTILGAIKTLFLNSTLQSFLCNIEDNLKPNKSINSSQIIYLVNYKTGRPVSAFSTAREQYELGTASQVVDIRNHLMLSSLSSRFAFNAEWSLMANILTESRCADRLSFGSCFPRENMFATNNVSRNHLVFPYKSCKAAR